MTDEETLRVAWEEVTVAPSGYTVVFMGIGKDAKGFDTVAEAIAFTEERRRQIADMEEVIEYMSELFGHVRSCDCSECRARDRILARERAALVELKRGMKEDRG